MRKNVGESDGGIISAIISQFVCRYWGELLQSLVQGLRLVLSNGPNRLGVSHHLIRGWKQTQSPKRCAL
jgi:hypothetical protein